MSRNGNLDIGMIHQMGSLFVSGNVCTFLFFLKHTFEDLSKMWSY